MTTIVIFCTQNAYIWMTHFYSSCQKKSSLKDKYLNHMLQMANWFSWYQQMNFIIYVPIWLSSNFCELMLLNQIVNPQIFIDTVYRCPFKHNTDITQHMFLFWVTRITTLNTKINLYFWTTWFWQKAAFWCVMRGFRFPLLCFVSSWYNLLMLQWG